jgi:hypothetical protein
MLTAGTGLWANEEVINAGNQVKVKIPSDIKPGLYILRTELLSLHGNGQYLNPGLKGLPQFYTHCYNIEITGDGTATPPGVKFPGGYPKTDPGVGFILGNKAKYASYVSISLAILETDSDGFPACSRSTRLQGCIQCTNGPETYDYTRATRYFPTSIRYQVPIASWQDEYMVRQSSCLLRH